MTVAMRHGSCAKEKVRPHTPRPPARAQLPLRFLDELHAYHEAGHAVAALLKGFSVRSVSIRRRGARGGECEYVAQVRFRVRQHQKRPRVPASTLRRLVRATAAVALGGSIAQDGFTLEHGYIGVDDRTGWPLPLFAPGASDDERLALSVVAALYRRRSERRQFLRRMRSATERLLTAPANWYAVRALATALLRVRQLDAAAAERVVRDALGPPRRGRRRGIHLTRGEPGAPP